MSFFRGVKVKVDEKWTWGEGGSKKAENGWTSFVHGPQWKDSFSKHLWYAFVMVFLAEMGRIPCCVRPESSSPIVWHNFTALNSVHDGKLG